MALINRHSSIPGLKRSAARFGVTSLVGHAVHWSIIALVFTVALLVRATEAQGAGCAHSIGCEIFLEICNKGQMDVDVALGIPRGGGWLGSTKMQALGWFPVTVGRCVDTGLNERYDFDINLALIGAVDGELKSIRLDAADKEITYKSTGGWRFVSIGSGLFNHTGGNAEGRTCVPADLSSAFNVELSSFNWDEPCPQGYIPIPLSNWVRASIYTDERHIYITLRIYPKKAQARPITVAQTAGASGEKSQTAAAVAVVEQLPAGAAINKLLVGTECDRGGAWMKYPGPSVFSIEATGKVTYVTKNFVDGSMTSHSTKKWNQADIGEAKLRTGGSCAVLELICKERSGECIHSEQILKGRKVRPYSYKSTWMYFSDKDRAKDARTRLTNLGFM